MFMNWDFILRIFIAGILGGIIGIEREYRSKEAGLRTHFLVGLGSGGYGHRFHRHGYHHLPETRSTRTYHSGRLVGYGGYRYDVRFGNVFHCRIGYRYGAGVPRDVIFAAA